MAGSPEAVPAAENPRSFLGNDGPIGELSGRVSQWAGAVVDAVRDMLDDAATAPGQLGQVAGFITRDGALGAVWAVVAPIIVTLLVGLGVAWMTRRLLAPAVHNLATARPEEATRAVTLAVRGFLIDLLPPLSFLVATLALSRMLFWDAGLMFSAPEGVREIIRETVSGTAVGWIAVIILCLPLGVGRPGLRLLAVTDAEATLAHRYVTRVVALGCGGWILAVVVYLLRLGTGVPHLILIATSLAVATVALFGLRHVKPAREGLGRFWRPLATISVFGLGATWIIGLLVEPVPPLERVLGTLLVLAVLPSVDGVLGFFLGRLRRRLLEVPTEARTIFVPVGEDSELRAVERAVAPMSADAGEQLERAVDVFEAVVRDAASWLVMIGAVIALAHAWSVDLRGLFGTAAARTSLGAGLDAVLTLMVGWYVWRLFQTGLSLRLTRDDAAEQSRARTIQPLLSSVGRLIIGAVALMAALSSLGINIAPLIASAGVVGIAVGFGAQTLVRDLFSGAFFLIEDVFRIGDYVEAANNAKGTVEKITFRTVALRHQNGPLHFVPYGALGSVRNNSRDWVIDKFELPLPVDVDSEKVRKMIKRIGEEMLVDAPCAHDIVEPLKTKLYRIQPGVKVFRCKFQSPPGQQFEVRAEALKRIEAAMKAAGIKFADPTMHLTINATQPEVVAG